MSSIIIIIIITIIIYPADDIAKYKSKGTHIMVAVNLCA